MQGRPNAIGTITKSEADTLLAKGTVKSKKFKTVNVFKYQIITVSPPSAYLLTVYKRYIYRTLKVKQRTCMFKVNDTDAFLLTYNGLHSVDIGRRAKEFFRITLNLQLNSNTIRSIVETHFERSWMQGTIYYNIIQINICI